MGFLKKLFGTGKRELSEAQQVPVQKSASEKLPPATADSAKPSVQTLLAAKTIQQKFTIEEIRGSVVNAIAVIHERGFVPAGECHGIAHDLANQFQCTGDIPRRMVVSADSSERVRKAREEELPRLRTEWDYLSTTLAIMLAEQLIDKNLADYDAVCLRGTHAQLGLVWFAFACR
jgi:hypothetical protein